MTEFLSAAFTMPTAVFSVLLILVLLYWLIFLLGIFDLDLLDGVFDSADALDALDGADALDAMDALDGADALDGVDGLDGADALDGAHAGGERSGCLGVLGLGGVPVAIAGSLLVTFGWIFSYFGMGLVAGIPALAAGGALLATGVGLAAFGLAVGASSIAVRPLRKLLEMAPVTGNRDLVGRICQVTTGRIDEKFGQAEVDDDGAPILIQARCRRDNELTRGSRAVIYEYDKAGEVFWVVPMDKKLDEAYDIET